MYIVHHLSLFSKKAKAYEQMIFGLKKFNNLDFLSPSMIWSTEYDLEYEFVLEKVL